MIRVSNLNICFNDGHLVGAQLAIPSDPSDYCWSTRDPVVGCSMLRCTVCGALVKQQPGYSVAVELPPVGTVEWNQWVLALCEQSDWHALPYLDANQVYRT